MGEKISELPEDVGRELEEHYSNRKFPYVVREGEDEFAVYVHSKPFGGSKLSDEERERREKDKQKAKDKRNKERLLKIKDKIKELESKAEELE